MKITLGIDLGTTYTCASYFKNNKITFIKNNIENNNLFPSVVAFNKEERLIGQKAKNQIIRNFENTIYNNKRLIGKNFNDPNVQFDINFLNFKVIEGKNNSIEIMTCYKEKIIYFKPEEISAMILEMVKIEAEKQLNTKITDVVITVPAYFNDYQRKSTIIAGEIAGLRVLRIINEPTAAALAFEFDKDNNDNEKILVFDLGGGTFDVSILNIKNKNFEVVTTFGDSHLGGEDFDNILMNYFVEKFEIDEKINLKNYKCALRRLKDKCEEAKIFLSENNEIEIEIDNIIFGKNLKFSLTRLKLEELLEDIFNKCENIVEKALKKANLYRYDINKVILVGGSSRINKIQQILEKLFGKNRIKKNINPDEAVSYGASIQAAILEKEITNINLVDITPLSLGLKTVKGVMDKIIKCNTPIPCSKTVIFSTYYDNQDKIYLEIYEGERLLVNGNNNLGNFFFDLFNIEKKGIPEIEITFEVDENSILKVMAMDLKFKNKGYIIIDNKNRLKGSQINEMKAKSIKLRAEDEINLHRIKAKLYFKSIKHKYMKYINNSSNNINIDDIEKIKNKIDNIDIKIKIDQYISSEMIYDQITELNILYDFILNN